MNTIWLLALSLLVTIPVVNAGDATQAEKPPVEVKLVPEVAESLSNPRQTMNTFVTAMQAVSEGKKQKIDDAISTLALDDVSELIRESRGKVIAYTLYSVIERSKKVVLSSINTAPENDRYVFGNYSQGKVEIVKQLDGRWLFSKETIHDLPVILEGLLTEPAKYGAKDPQQSLPFYIKLRSQLPEVLKGGFLLEYWQWLGVLLFIFIGSIADKFLAWLLARNVTKWKSQHFGFDSMDSTVLRPLGLMAMAIIWWFGLGLLGLPDTALVILSVAVKLLVSLSGIWSAFRLVDVLHAFLMKKARRTHNKFDDLLI
ncbi:MAG TPA: mechanosensitive ion channel family protein, partial [Methylophaga sp.]|nr:mechanosensitive ion channel family protein [Methylophaga sp.]